MAKHHRKELSFQAGEISPRFFGRSDTEVYNKGLEIAENVIIDTRGGVFKRKGFFHLRRFSGNNGRIFTLQATRQRYYTIVVLNGVTWIIAPGANILEDNLVLNSNFQDGSLNWIESNAGAGSIVDFDTGSAELNPVDSDKQLISNNTFLLGDVGWNTYVDHNQSLVIFDLGRVTLTPRDNAAGYAGVSQQITNASVGEPTELSVDFDALGGQLHVMVGTVEGDATYQDVLMDVSGTISFAAPATNYWVTVASENPNIGAVVYSIDCFEIIEKYASISQEVTVTALPTDNHIVSVDQSSDEPLYIRIGTTQGASDIAEFHSNSNSIFGSFIPNAASYWVTVLADGDETRSVTVTLVASAASVTGNPDGIQMPGTPWTEDELGEVHIVEVPDGKTIYFLHPDVSPRKLSYDPATDTFVPMVEVVFVNPPTQWVHGNYPATGCHFQGRLWLGATPDERQTFWGSMSGAPEDFSYDDGDPTDPLVTDAHAIELTLQEFGRIEWMLGTKNLILGAEHGEHIVTSSSGVITPSDFQIEQQSNFGSNNMQGEQVGEKVFYLTPDGRKLRAMAYDFNEDNWLSQDITFASEHVTKGIGKFSAWVQHPGNVFAVVMENGRIAALTYDRSSDTLGWSHIFTVDTNIMDIATARANGVNETVVLVQREAGFVELEVITKDSEYLDGYVSVFDSEGTNVITGLEHLEGRFVRPIVDGAVDPIKLVEGGQITTDRTGVSLYAGLPYSAKIKTLPPDVPVSEIRSWKKRWNKIWVQMLDSKQPLINGKRPPDRTPSTPMDLSEPARTGHVMVVNLGWDEMGQITIEQDLPVPMFVLAIYGQMNAESL